MQARTPQTRTLQTRMMLQTAATAARDKEAQQLARDKLYRRKRRVALWAVLIVAIAVPAIVLALLLG